MKLVVGVSEQGDRAAASQKRLRGECSHETFLDGDFVLWLLRWVWR